MLKVTHSADLAPGRQMASFALRIMSLGQNWALPVPPPPTEPRYLPGREVKRVQLRLPMRTFVPGALTMIVIAPVSPRFRQHQSPSERFTVTLSILPTALRENG